MMINDDLCMVCKRGSAPASQSDCWFCQDYDKFEPEFTRNSKPKPMTNGDKIRAMTDEELCDFILDKRENGRCFNDKCYHNDPNKGCDYCTLEWLKAEADHD